MNPVHLFRSRGLLRLLAGLLAFAGVASRVHAQPGTYTWLPFWSSVSKPANVDFYGSASLANTALDGFFNVRLTPESPGQLGTLIVNRPAGVPNQRYTYFDASFYFLMIFGNGADGMSFSYGSIASGNNGGGENGAGSGLRIAMPVYRRGGNLGQVVVYYNNVELARRSIDLWDGDWASQYGRLFVNYGPNGLNLTVNIVDSNTGATRYGVSVNNLAISGWAPQSDWRFFMGGRCGADTMRNQVYGLQITASSSPPQIDYMYYPSMGMDEDTSATQFLGFTDFENPAGATTSVSSSNPTLFPPGSLVLSEWFTSGIYRRQFLQLTPAANASGSATITYSVTEAGQTVTRDFPVTVNPINDAPTITATAQQTTEDTPLSTSVTVADVDTPLNSVSLTATASSNPALIPLENISVSGTSGSRSLVLTPRQNQHGTSTITLQATDSAGASTTATFVFTVTPVDDAPLAGPRVGARFPGGSSAVTAGHVGLPAGNSPHTVEAWILPEQLTAGPQRVLTLGPAGNGGHYWQIRLGQGGKAELRAGLWGVSPIVDGVEVPVGKWSHVAASWDGANYTLFVDGTFRAQVTPAQPVNFGAEVPLALGERKAQGETGFIGQIDEVRIWNTAVPEGDIFKQRLRPLRGDDLGLILYWRLDEGQAVTAFDSAMAANRVNGLLTGGATWASGLRRDLYYGTDSSLASLYARPNFPDSPQTVGHLTRDFEAPRNVGDNYGQRVTGVIIPPVTGDYTFWISSDDQSELFLTPDAQPLTPVRIAGVTAWTGPRVWTAEPGQQSSPIALEAGKRYTLTAYMTEGGGLDNLAVRWQLPGGTIEEPIPVSRFEYIPGWGTQPVLEDVPSPVLIPGFDVELAQREAGTEVRFEILKAPEHGTLSIAGSSRWWFDILTNVVYTPTAGFNGTDRFTYRLTDLGGNVSPPATIALEVAGANDPPVISLPITRINVLEDEATPPIAFTVTDEDHSVDDPAYKFEVIVPEAGRRLLQQSGVVFGGSDTNRTMTLKPRPGEIGTVTFTVVITDPLGDKALAQFALRVDPRPAYALVPMGTLSPQNQVFGLAVNDLGWAVGRAQSSANSAADARAVLFRGLAGSGVIENLGTLGGAGTTAQALGINSQNLVVGGSSLASGGNSQAFTWSGTMSALQAVSSSIFSVVNAVNDQRAFAGTRSIVSGVSIGYFIDPDGILSNIPSLGGSVAEALALNDSGLVVGYGRLASNVEKAFAWKVGQGAPRQIALLPGYTDNRAYGVNDDGIIVGAARSNVSGGLVLRAFREDLNVVSDLGTLPGGSNSVALGINSFGQIVGEATDSQNRQRAWLHTAGRNLDLNDLIYDSRTLQFPSSGWTLHSARGISRNGTIVGTGSFGGRNAGYIAVPAWVIGRQIAQPEGAVSRKPEIELLDKGPTDTSETAFHWSLYEKKLYALRPVTARLKWFTSDKDVIIEGTGTNAVATVITERIEVLGVAVWPKDPDIHVANAPVSIEPKGVDFQYSFQNISFETTGGAAIVDPTSKTFNSTATGYSVLYYLNTRGNPNPDPGSQSPYFDVVKTVLWSDPAHLRQTNTVIGSRIGDPGHYDYFDKTGWVYHEVSPYDGVGNDRAYDRSTRAGHIIPVNLDTQATADDLVVVWYNTNRIGIAWAYKPVHYSLAWPADNVADRVVIASTFGSGKLNELLYPSAKVYHQSDTNLPGFNPNEEHALVGDSNEGSGQALFALRNDLNAVVQPHASDPYALLKYRNPADGGWAMRVYKVEAEQPTVIDGKGPFLFRYSGTAGTEIQPPVPLSRLTLTEESHGVSGPYWEDYNGVLYARAAGAEGQGTNVVIRWFYPLQPGFFYDLDRNGTNDAPVGASIAWLDRHGSGVLAAPNTAAAVTGVPVQVVYDIVWPRVPTLQIGETLMNSKRGLPAVKNMARLSVVYDDLTPGWNPATESAPIDTLAQLYDPLSTRVLRLLDTEIMPAAVARVNRNGKEIFPKLPYVLRARLQFDPITRQLEFSGMLDELSFAGEPLLLPNVLSSREAQEIKDLAPGDAKWAVIVDKLYHLTRNPHGVDMNPKNGLADQALRIGLANEYVYRFEIVTNRTINPSDGVETRTITNRSFFPPTVAERALTKFTMLATNVVPEPLGSLPKALSAGLGGIPSAALRPGQALQFDGTDDAVDGGTQLDLRDRPYTIEFWARRTVGGQRRVVFSLGYSIGPNQQIAIGFTGSDQLFFEYDSSGAALVSPAHPEDLNQWVHWACVFDPNTNKRAIFRNGLPVAQDSPLAPFVGVGRFYLGRDAVGSFYKGELDEVRVWGNARTAFEVSQDLAKRLGGFEPGLLRYFRFDSDPGGQVIDSSDNRIHATATGNVTVITSTAPTGMPPRYMTLAENNDPDLGALKVKLHIVRIDDGPFAGDIKPILPDNVFDERLTMRHSSDFGGDPDQVVFQWWYKPDGAGFDPEDLPVVNPDGTIADDRSWILWDRLDPPQQVDDTNPDRTGWIGANQVVLGGGGQSGVTAISDNWFIVRYKGYNVGLNGTNVWSGWIGDPSGTVRPRAALAEGWVKRVIRGLNPFDARVADFHAAPVNTYASMLIQAGKRYEGDIAFNPSADNLNSIGLIEAYQTVLNTARKLSIEGTPPVNYNPANNALLLAASRIADLYMVLGNEAYADAQDPTIGFGTADIEYGTAASSIFAFQNQLDSLLAEELVLLRGRDDTFAGVGAPPVYNRLFWNFTLGEGEVAYKQAYNITDQGPDGFVDEKDARVLYPQGHGDAWGHYLTAVKSYYTLLRHPYFTWVPRTERVNVAGVAQEVDFLDERKFARAAAARANVGREVVNLTYREGYVEDPAGQWQGYKDTEADRAWGVTEWARRAGQGAYFDWLTANSILPSVDPNPDHVGIRKIDRTTVSELADISNAGKAVQATMDESDRGLNPVGLAKGAVSFDLDASFNEIGSTAQIGRRAVQGLTHFDQIMERAVKALQNSIRVFDEANRATQNLRRTQDSIDDLTRNSRNQELDYKNRLIEIFGYPYSGDIGPGKIYPSGYDGPDLYKFMYVDSVEITGANSPTSTTYTGFFKPVEIKAGAYTLYSSDRGYGAGSVTDPSTLETTILKVSYPTSAADYGFQATPEMGKRRAPGQIQQILGEMVQANAEFKIALQNYDGLIADIRDAIETLEEQEARTAAKLGLKGTEFGGIVGANVAIGIMKGVETGLRRSAGIIRDVGDALKEGMPKVLGLAADPTFLPRAIAATASSGSAIGLEATADALSVGQEVASLAKEALSAGIDLGIEVETARFELFQAAQEVEKLFRNEAAARIAAFNQAEGVRQIAGRYHAAIAEGLRLQDELVRFRRDLAADITDARYQDMTFRIFRNDALQKYRAQFDLAARYTYLAASAYDYEVNLLGDDPRAGGDFLAQIVRQRSLGQVTDGEPVVGQPGLADLLGRLIQNFDSFRGAFGFNNPQIEGNQFSLRSELFRVEDHDPDSGDDPSDASWRELLRSKKNSAGASVRLVDDVWDLPEFRRYCRPFAPESAGPQPALVVRFPTSITFGKNFFGWDLSPGDSAYDPSRFATKAKGVGVWFGNYNAGNLSRTPRVYLFPVGADVLRSPSQADDFATREWRVVDQVIPVPYPIGQSSLKDPTWLPEFDSLGGSFATIRRHGGFRAYPDSEFDVNDPDTQATITSDARMVGRSVWNTEWMLIIPGGTFDADAKKGLDRFIETNTDIKVLFQTYSYSGL